MIDATNPDDRITELEKRYNVQGLPAIIFLNSQQKEIESLRVTGFIDSKEFLKRMKVVK
jgi:thiol:disulfide interchange protein